MSPSESLQSRWHRASYWVKVPIVALAAAAVLLLVLIVTAVLLEFQTYWTAANYPPLEQVLSLNFFYPLLESWLATGTPAARVTRVILYIGQAIAVIGLIALAVLGLRTAAGRFRR